MKKFVLSIVGFSLGLLASVAIGLSYIENLSFFLTFAIVINVAAFTICIIALALKSKEESPSKYRTLAKIFGIIGLVYSSIQLSLMILILILVGGLIMTLIFTLFAVLFGTIPNGEY